ncbi:MAG: hypothetical protein EZS26_001392 [Candidatus Ordinivivax streblomastigis]|uniref:Uncharacterized protein n=1 Tax=Candidatus Ordinivivax streblomastigis TaxID=2540710 RepID=A0A5M8P2R6_9BACT|nr:MAG: hypothetical protein EZS26_001392 [Candidatus Ordinivivax streblomastigis]
MNNIHKIMFGELRPWLDSNIQPDEYYKPEIHSLNAVQTAFNQHYELKFIRHISNRTQYYKKLIDNDVATFCNTLFQETATATPNRTVYKISKANKDLHARIKEVANIVTTQKLNLSYINAQHADFSTDRIYKESTYILQQQAPDNTFIKEIQVIQIENIIEEKKKKSDINAPLAFTYKHLNKQQDYITNLFNSLKKNNRIAQDTPITDFKHAFSGVSVENPVCWTGAKSELPYLIKLLCNTHQVLNYTGSIWQIVKILIQHAAKVFEQLPAEVANTKQPNQKQLFLEALPSEFSRKDYLTIAQRLEIPDKTAEKHIAKFVQNGLINHFAHDKYKKP